MTRRVLVTDRAWPDLKVEQGILAEIDVELIDAPNGDEATLAGLADGACGILTCWARTTRRVIEVALPDLEVIVRYGVGLDNIDVEFATGRGVPVAYVPDYCTTDVAEHTIALLLSLSRKVGRFDQTIRTGTWDIAEGLPLRRVSGQVLGLIGFGRIAREVARRARALGLRVMACSPSLTSEKAGELGVEAASIDHLLAAADFLSIHCPSTEETRGMIDAEALGKLKPTACLINTSRGDIVDEEALADAIETGRLAGAALDVRVKEPPEEGDRLVGMPEVIHTPHAGFYSTESLQSLREQAACEVRRVLSGEDPVNLVNPDYLEARQGMEDSGGS
ncbi:MAG: C-terminal binding protein [Candidatus Latescibacteria bacterium]|jgi:D-3-phosphoglycerate dehydrogenase|nr:C-terminal binding protein [Candidatus Latescibacterota bacterium]